MKIAFLTAGGIAPCLSAAIGVLIQKYNELAPRAELLGYLNGYQGLFLGNSITFSQHIKDQAEILLKYGGSPIGNSRVKLTNTKDCVNRGLVREGENPLQVAANQLIKDGVDILHTIGGDDTNIMAAELAKYLADNDYDLTVVGLPKTVDNDVYPLTQTLGAWTAAEQGALFFNNVANENTTSTRQLIIHEVMGRNCGWLTAATARDYRAILDTKLFLPDILIDRPRWDIDAVYVPEMEIDIPTEVIRLRKRMDKKDGVNIFLSEGAGIDSIVKELESQGETVALDAFGHVKLDFINPGKWFAKQYADMLGADKTLVQKSGYFARSAAPNTPDLELIKQSATLAAKAALDGTSGLAGLDMEKDGELSLIDFQRIVGGKPFDIDTDWFVELLIQIGQPKGKKLS
ncbi:MAG: pyrophosphate--fructose-6-phosphate 1-phosphotransferase [Candidatus Marinimicrobia bacterium]|nr:pyrophosphate--fructose-6-phosphate 1-phosphotransferase [Candidatus Neomarinimicrobiota bacterium]